MTKRGRGADWRSSKVGSYCRDCTERYPACHDTCEKYNNLKNEWDAHKEFIREAKKNNKLYDSYVIGRVESEHWKKERNKNR